MSINVDAGAVQRCSNAPTIPGIHPARCSYNSSRALYRTHIATSAVNGELCPALLRRAAVEQRTVRSSRERYEERAREREIEKLRERASPIHAPGNEKRGRDCPCLPAFPHLAEHSLT